MKIDKKCDYHIHTTFSDGIAQIDEMVTAAISKGLEKIVITDHMPLPFDNRYAMQLKDIERYKKEIESAQKQYHGQITIKTGLEIEYMPSFAQWIHSIVDLGWDHLLVSIHTLFFNGQPYIVNGNQKEFKRLLECFSHNIEDLCGLYYETMKMAVRTGWFDIVGHLDVIKKNNLDQRYFSEASGWYRDMVSKTLDTLEDHDLKMEINMSGFHHAAREQYPSKWIIQEAVKRDIQLVLGSDSHKPETVGQSFENIDEFI